MTISSLCTKLRAIGYTCTRARHASRGANKLNFTLELRIFFSLLLRFPFASGGLLCVVRATSPDQSEHARPTINIRVYIYVRYDCDFRRLEREIGAPERIKFVPRYNVYKNKLDSV